VPLSWAQTNVHQVCGDYLVFEDHTILHLHTSALRAAPRGDWG
jgi:hypothetical protein